MATVKMTRHGLGRLPWSVRIDGTPYKFRPDEPIDVDDSVVRWLKKPANIGNRKFTLIDSSKPAEKPGSGIVDKPVEKPGDKVASNPADKPAKSSPATPSTSPAPDAAKDKPAS